MANFSVNQVRQFYVMKGEYAQSVTAASSKGTIGGLKEIKGLLGPEVMFFYKGADNDTVLPSDIIPLKNITYAKAYTAASLATKMRKVKVTLAITPTAGQDCVLGINFKNFFSSGDASQYYKDAAVHVTSAMVSDVKEFYKAMVAELNACFSREDGATATTNPYLAFSAGTAGSEDWSPEAGQSPWSSWTLLLFSVGFQAYSFPPVRFLYIISGQRSPVHARIGQIRSKAVQFRSSSFLP